MDDFSYPPTGFAVPAVAWSLTGRVALQRYRRRMWTRLAATWLGGFGAMALGAGVGGAIGVLAILLGFAVTAVAPGATVVFLIRDAIIRRRLREMPALPEASARVRRR